MTNNTGINPTSAASLTATHNCDICDAAARITIKRNHFCYGCLRARRIGAFLLSKASC